MDLLIVVERFLDEGDDSLFVSLDPLHLFLGAVTRQDGDPLDETPLVNFSLFVFEDGVGNLKNFDLHKSLLGESGFASEGGLIVVQGLEDKLTFVFVNGDDLVLVLSLAILKFLIAY